MGWGAFVAMGLRRRGLGRYRRGGANDLLALPALFVDVDDIHPSTLQRLQDMRPAPTWITFTGGGYHAYWLLDEPFTDMRLARKLLRPLAKVTDGDSLSPAQSLRLPYTRNSKPYRKDASCHVIHQQDSIVSVDDFAYLLPQRQSSRQGTRQSSAYPINPDALQRVTETFMRLGYKQSGDWLSGACIYPENHRNGDAHPSFGFNTRTGYGHCYVCGSILLKDICTTLYLSRS
ncbi:MAG: hypothetical protein AAFR67_00385 [Chloroflexota bacterium]